MSPHPRPLRRVALGLVALALATTVLIGLNRALNPPQAPEVIYRLIDGGRIDAKTLGESDLLVSFWSTSCSICLEKMPALAALHTQYASSSFTVIAVAVSYDPPSEVLRYLERYPLPFPVALDWDGQTAAAFGGIEGTPVMFLIDRNGEIIDRQSGTMDFDNIRAWLNEREKV